MLEENPEHFRLSFAGGKLHPAIPFMPEYWYNGYKVQHKRLWPPEALLEAFGMSDAGDNGTSGSGGRSLPLDLPNITNFSDNAVARDTPFSSFPALRRSFPLRSAPSIQQHTDYLDALPWELEKLKAEHLRLKGSSEISSDAGFGSNPIRLQQLFSVYVHTSSQHELPRRSIFHDFLIKDRVNTYHGYAQHALLQVNKNCCSRLIY